jgi:acetyl esterase/lipase
MRDFGIALFFALSFLSLAPLFAQSDFVREDDITYAQRGDLVLKLDIARPATGDGPFPAIVYIIDDWAREDLFIDRTSLYYDIPDAAKRGYVAATIDRRLSAITQNNKDIYQFPAGLYDVKSAVRWLRAHAAQYRVDPDRIGAIGFSSGGYLALLLGLTGPSDGLEGEGEDLSISSRVQAVVNIGGPTDMVGFWNDGGMKTEVEHLLGSAPQAAQDRYRQASPLSYVSANNPPILTIHADKDVLVPFHEAELLDARMKGVGASHTLFAKHSSGHANYMRDNAARKVIFDFFDKWLKKP